MKEAIEAIFRYIRDLPVAASVIDRDGYEIVFYNEKFSEILKVGRDEVLLLDEFEVSGGSPVIVWATSGDGTRTPLVTVFGYAEAEGRKFLVCTHAIAPASFMSTGGGNDFVRNMFDDLPALIFISNNSQREIVYVNNTVKELLGKDLLGKDCERLFEMVNDCYGDEMVDVEYNEKWFRVIKNADFWLEGQLTKLIVGIDVTEVKKSEQQLMMKAATDLMTGVYNRQSGLDSLKNCIEKVKNNEEEAFALVYIDINDLKYVNDYFGHSEGDNYILTVVSSIMSSIRKADIFARVGGDEFLIVFPTCIYKIAENIMEMVTSKLKLHYETDDVPFPYSISYGILEVNNHSHLDIEYILSAVDAKMYYMKEEYRRNRVLANITG